MTAATVLVTRPEPGAGETCASLAARGIAAFAAPMLTIVPAPTVTLAERPQAVLVTSANALAALAPIAGVALFAVGDATAARAAARGWAPCRSAGGDALALLGLCRAELAPTAGPLALLAGEGQGAPLATGLRRAGFAVTVTTAYAQRPVATFPEAASHLLAAGAVEAALFFSPSAARPFAALLPPALGRSLAAVRALAISEAAAAPLRALKWRALRVAARPNSADLLALL